MTRLPYFHTNHVHVDMAWRSATTACRSVCLKQNDNNKSTMNDIIMAPEPMHRTIQRRPRQCAVPRLLLCRPPMFLLLLLSALFCFPSPVCHAWTTVPFASTKSSDHRSYNNLNYFGRLYQSNRPENNEGEEDEDYSDWRYYSSDASNGGEDWLETLTAKQDGSFWTSFEPSNEEDSSSTTSENSKSTSTTDTDTETTKLQEEDESESWLETLAMLSAEEVQYNQKEGERADMVRKMQEYQFTPDIIASTLGVAMDTTLEDEDAEELSKYRQATAKYDDWDQVDMEQVESHTMVPLDPETKEPYRSQMVYVDEHTCIGCTNCAMVAQSTFFMHSEHGRARVFQQWGDDDETIQIAIETCPVDCIHYVPYDELVSLEQERRDQNINFKARLVSQSDNVGFQGRGFTAPQQISGNSLPRCSNCPSRGCYNCPMYGVGKNPEFERKEQARLARQKQRQLERERTNLEKRAEL